MTVMVSFRADDEDVAEADRWAARLGVERSELLRDALAGHLTRLAAEADVAAYDAHPFAADELALDAADDWGPAENWSDWKEWADRRDRAAG
jgi:Ribbon-helix-helix protein, copG family